MTTQHDANARKVNLEQLKKLRDQKLSKNEIAVLLGVSESTVRRNLRVLGDAPTRKYHPRVPLAVLMRARYFLEDGCSYPEAAETVGVSVDTLKRHFPGYTNQGRLAMNVINQRLDLKPLWLEIQSIPLPDDWPHNYK